MSTHHLTLHELSTILAALRYYQNDLDGRKLSAEVDPNGDLARIASNEGQLTPLSAGEIDELCERLNCEDDNTPGIQLVLCTKGARKLYRSIRDDRPEPGEIERYFCGLATIECSTAEREDFERETNVQLEADVIDAKAFTDFLEWTEAEDRKLRVKYALPVNKDKVYALKPRVVIAVEGGVMQSIVADAEISPVVLDYDVEGVDEDKLTAIPQSDKQGEELDASAVVRFPMVEVSATTIDRLLANVENKAKEDNA